MWSIHVVPNTGTSCLAWEEKYQISDTCNGEKKEILRCGGGGRGIMLITFEANLRPVMSVIE